VFEFLDVDLKRYMETGNQNRTPITLDIAKVSYVRPELMRVVTRCIRVVYDAFSFVFFFSLAPLARDNSSSRPDINSTAPMADMRFFFTFLEIYASAHLGLAVLSFSSYTPPRSQASESPHRQA